MMPSTQLRRLLVANRGEIARRIFHTCRELGIETVAVASDADASAPHALEADHVVRLPGSAAADTYLRADLLIEAARRSGADAVHPGYGFLSERADFARSVLAAGLTWIGPPPDAIEAMGSKIAAKKLMADAGVPVLAELHPDDVSEHDLPVLIKASAGGGGRGMRIVRSLAELPEQLASARAEAGSAFGDATVFCEPYLATGRHIEVQILADAHGTVWALGERDCSIQRRHQKIIEEAPAPAVSAALRDQLFTAAITAARAIGYVGAGTVEFLVAAPNPAGSASQAVPAFHFLEMNTRLQVEHPVTECVTGLDLVALQLDIAEGGRLAAQPPPVSGHAIEVRLYAEDPARDWRPSSGALHAFDIPGVTVTFEPLRDAGLRLDSGVPTGGSVVGTHYDPMLAKLIAYAPNRAAAARRLAAALAGARIHGLTTNRDLLVRVLRSQSFLDGEVDTAFLARHAELVTAGPDESRVRLSAIAAALAAAAGNRASAKVLAGLPSGWRNLPSAPRRARFTVGSAYTMGSDVLEVAYRGTRAGIEVDGLASGSVIEAVPDRVVLAADGVRRTFRVASYGARVEVDSPLGAVTLFAVPLLPGPESAGENVPGSLLAPMPGSVVRIAVRVGERVSAGQPLLWLEAMKMQHQIVAPLAGIVGALPVSAGSQVEVGAVLVVIEPVNTVEESG